MVLDHRDIGVSDEFLFRSESGIEVYVELLAELFDDDGRVRNLFAVHLHEGQLSFLALVLHLVVNILKQAVETTLRSNQMLPSAKTILQYFFLKLLHLKGNMKLNHKNIL